MFVVDLPQRLFVLRRAEPLRPLVTLYLNAARRQPAQRTLIERRRRLVPLFAPEPLCRLPTSSGQSSFYSTCHSRWPPASSHSATKLARTSLNSTTFHSSFCRASLKFSRKTRSFMWYFFCKISRFVCSQDRNFTTFLRCGSRLLRRN